MNSIMIRCLIILFVFCRLECSLQASVIDDLMAGKNNSHQEFALYLKDASEAERDAFWDQVQSSLSDDTIPALYLLNMLFHLSHAKSSILEYTPEMESRQHYATQMAHILEMLIEDEGLRQRLHDQSKNKLLAVFRSTVGISLLIPVPEAVDPLHDLIHARAITQHGDESLFWGQAVWALCCIRTPESVSAQKLLWNALKDVELPVLDKDALNRENPEDWNLYNFRRRQFGVASALAVYGQLPLEEIRPRLLYLIEDDERRINNPDLAENWPDGSPAWKLSAFFPETREELIGLLDSQIENHVEVALMMIAHEGLTAEGEKAIRFLDHESKDLRMRAFDVVVYNNRVDLLNSLEAAYHSESDPNTKERMLFSLGLMVGPEPALMIQKLYETASDQKTKRQLREISRNQRGRSLPACDWKENLFRSRAAKFLPSVEEGAR